MDNITLENQIVLLENERQPYINTRFVFQARMQAVNNLIERGFLKPEDKQAVLDELTKLEAWIAEYTQQINDLKVSHEQTAK